MAEAVFPPPPPWHELAGAHKGGLFSSHDVAVALLSHDAINGALPPLLPGGPAFRCALRLRLTKGAEVTRADVTLVGREWVRFHRSEGSGQSRHTVTYANEGALLELPLLSLVAAGDSVRHVAGEHVMPFPVFLPPRSSTDSGLFLPSFAAEDCGVEYKLVARVQTAGVLFSDKDAVELPLHVIAPVGRIPDAGTGRVVVETFAHNTFCCCGSSFASKAVLHALLPAEGGGHAAACSPARVVIAHGVAVAGHEQPAS
jgi:hypothetical protein